VPSEPHPASHLQIRANLTEDCCLPAGTPLERIHFPTGRTTIEAVIRLLAEPFIQEMLSDTLSARRPAVTCRGSLERIKGISPAADAEEVIHLRLKAARGGLFFVGKAQGSGLRRGQVKKPKDILSRRNRSRDSPGNSWIAQTLCVSTSNSGLKSKAIRLSNTTAADPTETSEGSPFLRNQTLPAQQCPR
jgi:hypothetical protein